MTSHGAVERLQLMLDDYVENFGAIGVIVGIDLPEAGRLCLTAGSRAQGEAALGSSDLFQIGSQAKTFVALSILLLCRDGLLDLDDPVARHIDLPVDGRITLRHLIMNTSGLPEYLSLIDPTSAGRMAPRDMVIPALEQGVLFAPGQQFDYSNTGWVIAAMVMDARAPGGYAGYVKKRIFGPLGMQDSWVGSGYPEERLAQGYLKRAGQPAISAARGFSLAWAYGAGDIISNCGDMLDFYRALSRPGNPLGVTLQDMTAHWALPAEKPFHPMSLGAAYGLGLERRRWGGLEVWGHPGRTVGYGASSWFVPSTGAIATTAFMYVEDETEPPHIAAQRYNPSMLFTQVLCTAHALTDLLPAAVPAPVPVAGNR
ncbi:MAG: class A beta-lactamase-related serine hydrolase [Paracoccus sp. BP8]|nr:MAG: class A beta-lactamase-related serine hydrolase [Paracoccus sp. BP8]